jgi:hypothetical protein
MSHYLALVLIKDEPAEPEQLLVQPARVTEHLDRLLAPYDENTEVAPYEETCSCVGREAQLAGREHADRVVGSFDDKRTEFRATVVPQLGERLGLAPDQPPTDRQANEAWAAFIEDFRAAHEVAELAAARAHPMFERPAPNCDECSGGGTRLSTYNPKSKWDWWVIGGRWDGIVVHGAPREGENSRESEEQLDHNAARVSELKESILEYVHAIITPDGAWHEQGRMGWWGMVMDEKPENVWRNEAATILLTHRGALAVGCDLHI